MMRCIEIAYQLIKRGEKPTADGIKRAYDVEVVKRSNPKEYFERNKDHFDFYPKRKSPKRTPFITFSPVREENCNNRTFEDCIRTLHRYESELDDIDFEILEQNLTEVTRNEKNMIKEKLNEIQETDPMRFKRLTNMFMNKLN